MSRPLVEPYVGRERHSDSSECSTTHIQARRGRRGRHLAILQPPPDSALELPPCHGQPVATPRGLVAPKPPRVAAEGRRDPDGRALPIVRQLPWPRSSGRTVKRRAEAA